MNGSGFGFLREQMVERQIRARGIRDPLVLRAIREVERHNFVMPGNVAQAYDDTPLPIGEGQTISQPYIVALMTELARVDERSRVLEIGTGCGYQAAVLSRIAAEVFTIEIIESLGKSAEARFAQLGFHNVHVRIGDGYYGWPEAAPFDSILVVAAAQEVPPPLLDQLKQDGRLVIPIGEHYQELEVITKREGGFHRETVLPVRFVKLTRY
jgi:protein-L-isoaspartate(D-aspartate) O-methyltransferase